MRKKIASLSFLLLSFAASAQTMGTTSTEKTVEPQDYNKWSIELNGGVNKPLRALTPGYSTATLNPFHTDLGVRYMFSPKFGLKFDIGYDQFTERDNTPSFKSEYWRTSIQGVVNIGRALNFETWTNTFGLLGHAGVGVSRLSGDNGLSGKDYMGNGIVGLTGQIRLSNRVALTGDLTGIVNGRQNFNYDVMSRAKTGAFDGVLLNASVGLTFYLGKNEKHADWYSKDKYDELEGRVAFIETGLMDSDKDGVADLYDLEPNSIAGVAVNTKGQSIDNNQNGVPDELESYLDANYARKTTNNSTTNSTVEELINDGYVNVYFDFNSSKPTNASLSGVDFLVKYLKNNPSASAEIIGYADEVGNSSYNQELSQKRAEAVKRIVENAGIDGSKLTVKGNGEDTSVNKNSAEARQIVRRVTFKVK